VGAGEIDGDGAGEHSHEEEDCAPAMERAYADEGVDGDE